MHIIHSPSPNFNTRKNGGIIDMLILHYTDMIDHFDALNRMQDPECEVSAHYLIDTNGDIYQLVDDEKRAWHAGRSYWQGVTDVNAHSIGIEISNPGHSHGYVDFPDAQIAALIELCQDLITRHNIPAANVIGHSDIAPARKIDPGERMPWAKLAENGIGLFPHNNIDHEQNDYSEKDIADLFEKIGYNPDDLNQDKIAAFQRHYMPEIFLDLRQNEKIGIADAALFQKLKDVYQLQLDHRPKS